tara:strand:- start:718 stop:1002 length:285 start_codon:yes stop_codon:yes gene_type:complete
MKVSTLVKRALKDKPKWKASKGYKYLGDLTPGDKFITSSGLSGILIRCETNATVLITDASNHIEADRPYYLGKQTIAAQTEVKLLGNVNGYGKE